jgi:hypothetical protein
MGHPGPPFLFCGHAESSRTLHARQYVRTFSIALITAVPPAFRKIPPPVHGAAGPGLSIAVRAPARVPMPAGSHDNRIAVTANADSVGSSRSTLDDHKSRRKNIFDNGDTDDPRAPSPLAPGDVPVRSCCRYRWFCSCRFLRPRSDFRYRCWLFHCDHPRASLRQASLQ